MNEARTDAVVKMYSDYKSPYAWLAFERAFELENSYRIKIRWIPFQLRLKGSGQRSQYSEFKIRYSYMDARRIAGKDHHIRGPLKIFDTRPALIGGLFAEKHGRLFEYSKEAYRLFFLREFEADDPEAVGKLLQAQGMSSTEYARYLEGEGAQAYDRAQEEALADQIFGVPILLFNGEMFWGQDRIWLLKKRFDDAGLAISA